MAKSTDFEIYPAELITQMVELSYLQPRTTLNILFIYLYMYSLLSLSRHRLSRFSRYLEVRSMSQLFPLLYPYRFSSLISTFDISTFSLSRGKIQSQVPNLPVFLIGYLELRNPDAGVARRCELVSLIFSVSRAQLRRPTTAGR